MTQYSIVPRTGKRVKGYGFSSFAKKYKKQLLVTRLNASNKIVYRAGEFLGNKIADVTTKSNDDNIEKQEPAEYITISPEKRKEILNKLRKILQKWNTKKYLNY